MRRFARHHLIHRAGADQCAAGFAALRAEVDDPVGGADDVEVVLDHHQRVAGGDEAAEGLQQLGDVVEVQARRRLVEEEQRRPAFGVAVGEVAGELEALRLAAGERRHRLAEAQVVEADVGERGEARQHVGTVGEESQCLGDGELQHLGDRLALHRDFQHLGAEALAVAVGAAQVDVGEELHLDVLEAVAAAGGTPSVAGVEAEGARRVAALLRNLALREQIADRVEGADVAGRVGARRLADRRLVDHRHLGDVLHAAQGLVLAGGLGGFPLVLAQGGVEHVLHQGRLARSRDAGDADQAVERKSDVEVFQVVLGGAENLQPRAVRCGRVRRKAGVGALAAFEVFRRQRLRLAHFLRRAEEHHLAAALAGAGAHVEQAVGFKHDLRVVLDHHQRVAGVA